MPDVPRKRVQESVSVWDLFRPAAHLCPGSPCGRRAGDQGKGTGNRGPCAPCAPGYPTAPRRQQALRRGARACRTSHTRRKSTAALTVSLAAWRRCAPWAGMRSSSRRSGAKKQRRRCLGGARDSVAVRRPTHTAVRTARSHCRLCALRGFLSGRGGGAPASPPRVAAPPSLPCHRTDRAGAPPRGASSQALPVVPKFRAF